MIRRAHRNKPGSEIPTASLADIAFLLLAFFLVTTTIDVDTGIAMVLPPVSDHPPPELRDRNMLRVLIGSQGELLVEDRPMRRGDLRATIKQHVLNCAPGYAMGCVAAYAEDPARAVVSIKASASTPYAAYIEVLDEAWMAYFEMWDVEAQRQGFADYAAYRAQLPPGAVNDIRRRLKAQISLADPTRVDE